MARQPGDSSNWGGKREGAGRRRDELPRVQCNLRMRVPVVQKCRAIGTKAVEAHLAQWFAEMEGTSPESLLSPNGKVTPGFDSVDAKEFVPASQKPEAKLPNVAMDVDCGFPSPALDYSAEEMSLSDLMISNPASTFFAQAKGDSMVDAGIWEGDTLIFNRSLEPETGDIVLAYLHGDFTVKRYKVVDKKPVLFPENEAAKYPEIHPSPYDDFRIEAVLVGLCRKVRR